MKHRPKRRGVITNLDPLWSDGLRNHDKSLVSTPSDQDLCWGLVDLLGDLLDGWCVDHSGFTGDVVAQWRVGGDDDLLLLACAASQLQLKRRTREV